MPSDIVPFELANTKTFARLCSYAIIAWVASLLLALVVGTVQLGHLPVYGVDPDPERIHSMLLNGLQITHLLLSAAVVVAIPAWALLLIHLLSTDRNSLKQHRALWACTIVAIGIYFLIRHTPTFVWLMD